MPPETLHYDRIGANYSLYRQPDPRLMQAILTALGGSQQIVNVGAGTGSYEPSGCTVVAVEPSREMIRQRGRWTAPAVCASAEQLPFANGRFDAALAILSIHHWGDWQAGLREMHRVAHDRIVLLTWDPTHAGFWLVQDYFPDLLECDRQIFPTIAAMETVLGKIEVQVLPIPHDCVDGFLGAYWRRPSAYLDAGVRSAISTFSRITTISPRLAHLRADLESGDWAAKNADILELDQLDLGYRLVVCSKK
jgi:SAM-dependent methyltransferase